MFKSINLATYFIKFLFFFFNIVLLLVIEMIVCIVSLIYICLKLKKTIFFYTIHLELQHYNSLFLRSFEL